ncbi:hypothetical protein [Porticoccus sp.]
MNNDTSTLTVTIANISLSQAQQAAAAIGFNAYSLLRTVGVFEGETEQGWQIQASGWNLYIDHDELAAFLAKVGEDSALVTHVGVDDKGSAFHSAYLQHASGRRTYNLTQ